jgi:hypothetical protein
MRGDPYPVQIGSTFIDPTKVRDNYWPEASVLFSDSGTVNTIIPGVYLKSYTAIDASGNRSTKSRKYEVSDFIKPVISGQEVVIAQVKEPFTEPMVNVSDNMGATLSRSGTYDISKLGTY